LIVRAWPFYPKLEFLTRLVFSGRFDEIGRRLMGRHRVGTILDRLERLSPIVGRGPIPAHPWRIAAFIHDSGLSGAPLSLVDLATALTARGLAQVRVLAPSEGPITAACRAAGLDVIVHGVELRNLLTRRRWNEAIAHLADLVRTSAADIVHANSVMTAPALAAARLAGIPALLNVREDRPDQNFFGFLPHDIAIDAFQTLRTATEVVFVSQASHDGWRRYFASDACRIIPNALRHAGAATNDRALVRARLDIDEATTLVLCVGSFCERKGQIDLVGAVADLPEDLRRRVHVAMVGEAEPAYLAELRRRIDSLGIDLRNAFSLLSAQAQPDSLYRAADVFVCCSRSESFPRVTIEAMRAGLPIVTTPVSGIVEQLNSDEAIFYPPGDSKRLAEAIARLAEDSTLRADLGCRALAAFARHADFDAMVDRYVQSYRRAFQP